MYKTIKHCIGKKREDIIIFLREHYSEEEIKSYIAKTYRDKFGRSLDWNHLERYSEKMQWDKAFNLYPHKAEYSDKIQVRKFIKETIGDQYLIPIYGLWGNFNEIDFNELPDQFVLKLNNGSGINLIVKDKNKVDWKKAKEMFTRGLKHSYAYSGFEMHYAYIRPLIYAEKYMDDGSGELTDYKFQCFSGKPYYCWCDTGRFVDHRRNIFDLDWKLLPFRIGYENTEKVIPRPKNFSEMIEIAEQLSKGFAQVRIDLYNINGKIYFGEMTFTSESGLARFIPDSMDEIIGKLWNLEIK